MLPSAKIFLSRGSPLTNVWNPSAKAGDRRAVGVAPMPPQAAPQGWKPSPIAYQQVAQALQRVQKARAHWATKLESFWPVARQGEARYARWEEMNRKTRLSSPSLRTGRNRADPSGPALGLDDGQALMVVVG